MRQHLLDFLDTTEVSVVVVVVVSVHGAAIVLFHTTTGKCNGVLDLLSSIRGLSSVAPSCPLIASNFNVILMVTTDNGPRFGVVVDGVGGAPIRVNGRSPSAGGSRAFGPVGRAKRSQ